MASLGLIRNLASGKACTRCRTRKMKCSGTKPVCLQCQSAKVPEDCEYLARNERSKASRLQEDIDRLQARLVDLQDASGGTSSSQVEVHLHHPYHQVLGQTDPSEEPPQETKEHLVDIFLENASELGFGLSPTRFRAVALLPYPLGHHARPTKALMSIVYVWGTHLSHPQDPGLKQLEEYHLAITMREVSSGIAGTHPDKILHTLQAEFLLARYLFSTGKIMEGKYHVTCGISMAVASGFTKIRSNQTSSRSPVRGISFLPPPVDAVDEGERIVSCWQGFTTDKLWAAALETSSDMICPATIPDAQTDTPWPRELEVYEQGGDFDPQGYSFTTVNFITETPTSDRGDSTLATLAKASYCWERAADLAKEDLQILTPDAYAQFLALYSQRRQWIANFISTMTALKDISNPTPAKVVRLLEAHSVAHAANIQTLRILPTHDGSEDAFSRAQAILSSAQTIINLLVSPSLDGVRRYINPVMGTVWKLAYTVLIEEIHRTRANALSHMAQWQHETIQHLQRGLTVIIRLSETCMFMKYQLDEIQKVFAAINEMTC